MRDRLYSTADLARICGVSISTIKRWTDSGILRCVRTPGGHRKFRLQDVAAASRQMGTNLAAVESEHPPAAQLDELALLLLHENHEALIAKVVDHLESGDDQACRETLLHLHRHGTSIPDLVDRFLRPAFTEIEQQHGQTRDSYVLRRAWRLADETVRHLIAHLPQAPPQAPLALVAAASGEGETLWPAFAHLVLMDCGWRVLDLGCGVPVTTLRGGITRERPRMVVVFQAQLAAGDQLILQNEAEAQGGSLVLLSSQHADDGVVQLLMQQLQQLTTDRPQEDRSFL